jgi:hypothetical protein
VIARSGFVALAFVAILALLSSDDLGGPGFVLAGCSTGQTLIVGSRV